MTQFPVGKMVSVVTAVLLALVPTLRAEQVASTPSKHDWNNVRQLGVGRQLLVELDTKIHGNRKFRGTLEAVDDNGLQIVVNTRDQVRLPRESIRKVKARRRGAGYGKVIGAATGTVVLGVLTGREEDFSAEGRALFIGAGLGLGLLAGWAFDRGNRNKLIYERP